MDLAYTDIGVSVGRMDVCWILPTLAGGGNGGMNEDTDIGF